MNIKETVEKFLEELPSQFPDNITLDITKECYEPDPDEPEGMGNGWGPDYAIFIIEVDDFLEGDLYCERHGYPNGYMSILDVNLMIIDKLKLIFEEHRDTIAVNFFPYCSEWEVHRKKPEEKEVHYSIYNNPTKKLMRR